MHLSLLDEEGKHSLARSLALPRAKSNKTKCTPEKWRPFISTNPSAIGGANCFLSAHPRKAAAASDFYFPRVFFGTLNDARKELRHKLTRARRRRNEGGKKEMAIYDRVL